MVNRHLATLRSGWPQGQTNVMLACFPHCLEHLEKTSQQHSNGKSNNEWFGTIIELNKSSDFPAMLCYMNHILLGSFSWKKCHISSKFIWKMLQYRYWLAMFHGETIENIEIRSPPGSADRYDRRSAETPKAWWRGAWMMGKQGGSWLEG